MLSWSRGGHIGFSLLEIIRGPGPPSTSGYADGHRVQMYVSITNTDGVMAILMISWSGDGHIWFFLNAIGRNFAHPLENFVLDHYELISIDGKSLYNNST